MKKVTGARCSGSEHDLSNPLSAYAISLLAKSKMKPDPGIALRRFDTLRPLATEQIEAVEEATAGARWLEAGTEIIHEGDSCGMHLLLTGWAAQTRILTDGRRQIVGFLVPGDQFEYPFDEQHRAATSTLALCRTAVCSAPIAPVGSELDLTYRLGEAQVQLRQIDQIARLGRFSAAERLCDLLLELLQRLTIVGLVENHEFDMPVTQDLLSDALGLTPVHTNRTLQLCRHRGDIVWQSGRVRLPDAPALAQRLGRRLAQ